MTIEVMGTRELATALERDPIRIMKDGYDKGFNVSAYLDRLSPTDGPDQKMGLDAFSRLLKHYGIVTRSDRQTGYWASSVNEFLKDNARKALMMEYAARVWRRVSNAKPSQPVYEERLGGQRAIYLSDGQPGSWERPYVDAMDARWSQQIAPAIPLAELIATTTPIEGDLYRAYYLTYNAADVRKYRVGESTEIPTATLSDADRSIKLHKFGRALKASYEQLRRMRVDKFAMHIAMMAIQAEIDKVAKVIDVVVNGDGNSGTSATNHDLTTLDTDATAGTLTLKGWLSFKLKFANPYSVNVTLMQEAVALQLQLLNMGSANVPYVALEGNGILGGIRPINRFADNVGFGWTSDAPTLKIVAIDSNWAIEQVTEIGGEISETERFIMNQTEALTMTEVEGYAVLDPNSMRTLDVNA